jgi:hypothetical protein
VYKNRMLSYSYCMLPLRHGTQNKNKNLTLGITTFCIRADCSYAVSHSAQCHIFYCDAKCRRTECSGAILTELCPLTTHNVDEVTAYIKSIDERSGYLCM